VNFTIDISKEYECDAKTLFRALSEGVLFKYTGAHMDKLQMDFREGGELRIDWGDSQVKGEFIAIAPDAKVAFTWNFFDEDLKQPVATVVSISIDDAQGKSKLNLVHEGICSDKQRSDLQFGWTDAVEDMAQSHFA